MYLPWWALFILEKAKPTKANAVLRSMSNALQKANKQTNKQAKPLIQSCNKINLNNLQNWKMGFEKIKSFWENQVLEKIKRLKYFKINPIIKKIWKRKICTKKSILDTLQAQQVKYKFEKQIDATNAANKRKIKIEQLKKFLINC